MSRAFAFSLVVATACTVQHGDEGFFVLDNTATPMSGGCTFTGDATQPALFQGVVDVAALGANTPYFLAPLLQSRMVVPMGQSPFYKTIIVEGARVDLNGAATGSFQVLADVALAPGATANDGFSFPIGTTTPGVVQATVTFHGKLAGGGEITATPWTYGITVCNGCLINVLTYTDMTTKMPTSQCPAPAVVNKGNPCNVFQDAIVDCCTEPSGALTCPARTS